MKKYRFLIARRLTQLMILGLFVAGNIAGLKVLQGNLSSSLILNTLVLSDPYAVLQIFFAGAVVTVDMLVGALIVASFFALFGGRSFCSWVCPINIVSDTAHWIRRRLKLSKIQRRFYLARDIRFWVLGLSLVLSTMMGLAAFEIISPISMLHRGIVFGMGFGLVAVAVLFLFDVLVHENGWCGHVCPLGAFYATISRFSLIEIQYDLEKCKVCMECKVVCPEKEVLHMVTHKSSAVSMSECTKCARCIEVCSDDALRFGIHSYIQKKEERI